MNDLKKAGFFLWKWFITLLPLWLTIVAVFFWHFGYTLKESDPEKPLQKLMYGVASAALSGGVFAAMLKSLQFTGIFRDELRKVLFANVDWLMSLSEDQFRAIWKNVIKASIKKGIPSIADQIGDRLILDMMPLAEEFSYSKMQRRITIDDYNADSDIATIVDEYSLQIDAHDPSTEINYVFSLSGEWPNNLDVPPYQVTALMINDKDHISSVVQKGEKGSSDVSVSHAIKLKGDSAYSVFRSITRRTKIGSDPLQKMVSTRYIDSINLTVENRVPNKISVEFAAISIKDENVRISQIENTPTRSVVIYGVRGLIFPEQGFILCLTKK